jgi:hypothetical protein
MPTPQPPLFLVAISDDGHPRYPAKQDCRIKSCHLFLEPEERIKRIQEKLLNQLPKLYR